MEPPTTLPAASSPSPENLPVKAPGVPPGARPPGPQTLPRPVVVRPGILQRWLPAATPTVPLLVLLGVFALACGALLLARPGLQWGLLSSLLLAIAVVAARGGRRSGLARPSRAERSWQLAIGLLAVALAWSLWLRDSETMTFWVIAAAFGLGCYGLLTDRRARGVLAAPALAMAAGLRGMKWLRGAPRPTFSMRSAQVDPAVVRGSLGALLVVLVVGALLASADDAFAGLVNGLLPRVDLGLFLDFPMVRLVLVLAALPVALGVAYASASPADLGPVHHGSGRARIEWLPAVLGLLAVLGAFLLVQAAVLFDRYPDALVSGLLTPAERARQGFGQLVVVTVIVVAVLSWVAARVRAGDRRVFTISGGLLMLLVLALCASALRRVLLYQETFGWTVARVQAAAFEGWLAVVLVLLAVLWWLGKGSWAPRVVVGTAGLGVLVMALIGPDAVVARASVQRYADTGKIDLIYLGGLGPDAVPALTALPEPARSCALVAHNDIDWDGNPVIDPWYAQNLSRAHAQKVVLAGMPYPDLAEQCYGSTP